MKAGVVDLQLGLMLDRKRGEVPIGFQVASGDERFQAACSWPMGCWIFIWGDLLTTDLAAGETCFVAP